MYAAEHPRNQWMFGNAGLRPPGQAVCAVGQVKPFLGKPKQPAFAFVGARRGLVRQSVALERVVSILVCFTHGVEFPVDLHHYPIA